LEGISEMASPGAQSPRNFYFFLALCFINLFNYVDRGIIPGATNEFNSFIQDTLGTSSPDIFLGLLQSSFIVGFSVGAIYFGNAVHSYPPFFLCGVGMGIWVTAVCLSGLAYYANSYEFLFIARMLSGVGEASFQTSMPPWITRYAGVDKKGNKRSGTWLAIFYTAVPVGTAMGYTYGSAMATGPGWEYAYFVEGAIILPCVFFLFYFAAEYPCESVALRLDLIAEKNAEKQARLAENEEGVGSTRDGNVQGMTSSSTLEDDELIGEYEKPSIWSEIKVVLDSPVYCCICLGYAAQTGSLIGLSTFGSAFLLGLGFFDSETESSTIFGILISISGIVGTPFGGKILDYIVAKGRVSESESDGDGRDSKALLGGQKELRSDAPVIENTSSVSDHVLAEHVSQLPEILKALAMVSFSGACIMCTVTFMRNKAAFLILIFLGCAILFATSAGINVAVMKSVNPEHKAFAIAFGTVAMHVLGDVPSPVIAGALKDDFAPGCVGDDDEVSASPSCRDDASGLRLTMLLVTLWLFWTFIFFYLAHIISSYKVRTWDHLFTRMGNDKYAALPQDTKSVVPVKVSLLGTPGGGRKGNRSADL
jgi:predicted MFS family arabinose efflux permease